MQIKSVKIITIIALLFIIVLQVIWLYNTYILFEKNILKESCDVINKALYHEASIRFESVPKGTVISGPSEKGVQSNIPEVAYLTDGLSKLGYPISLSDVDSISDVLLKEKNIDSSILTCIVNPKDGTILQKSKNLTTDSWGIIKSEIIPIKVDRSQGIQLFLMNPYYTIFGRMGLLMVATAIMMALVICCIIYQIKIIMTQNKIARIRKDFSYAMVHDMKTPLGAIMASSDLLHSGRLDHKPEMKEQYFKIVKREANNLLTLSNKILTLSKLESGKLEIIKTRTALQPMIEELIEKFTAQSTKTIRFSLDIKENEVYVDAEYFKEVMSNLLDNAIKYSRAVVEIEISSIRNEQFVIVKVRDNGLGISEKDQKIIFDKFERGAAFKRTYKGGAAGFGLGLNYVYQVMDAHDGRVFVHSKKEEYSEFVLFIPNLIENL